MFHGAAAAACRKAGLFFVLLGPIPTIMLFGQKAPWVFAFGCLPVGWFLLGFYLLLKRIDRLELDDAAGMIALGIGRPVPYEAVRELRFETDGALTRIACNTSARRPTLLLRAANPAQTARLRQELSERCPDAAISNTPRSAAKAAALLAVLLVGLHAGFLWYCRGKWPVVRVACEAFEWPSAAPGEPVRKYELDGMRYSIPTRFEPAAEPANAETRRFRDHASGQEIRAHSARLSDWLGAASLRSTGSRMPGPSGAAYLRLVGIDSTFDLMRWPFCDRVGAVPLILKAALIAPAAEPWKLALYETGHACRGALIEVDSSDGDATAQILAVPESGGELMLTVSGPNPIEAALIATLLRGLGFAPE